MIVDIFYLIVGVIFQGVIFVLSPLQYIIPASFTNAVLYLFGYMSYFGGVIDLGVLASCLQALISFEIVYYIYKIVLFLIHLTPWIGNPKNPQTVK